MENLYELFKKKFDNDFNPDIIKLTWIKHINYLIEKYGGLDKCLYIISISNLSIQKTFDISDLQLFKTQVISNLLIINFLNDLNDDIKIKKIDCCCGSKYKLEKHKKDKIHLLYEYDIEMFHIINIYKLSKKFIVELLVKYKIDKRNVIIKLINLYKNNNSFPIINDDYEIFNSLTYDELIYSIQEFKLKIPYYNKLTKDQL